MREAAPRGGFFLAWTDGVLLVGVVETCAAIAPRFSGRWRCVFARDLADEHAAARGGKEEPEHEVTADPCEEGIRRRNAAARDNGLQDGASVENDRQHIEQH